jgi:hypothetical protein
MPLNALCPECGGRSTYAGSDERGTVYACEAADDDCTEPKQQGQETPWPETWLTSAGFSARVTTRATGAAGNRAAMTHLGYKW